MAQKRKHKDIISVQENDWQTMEEEEVELENLESDGDKKD